MKPFHGRLAQSLLYFHQNREHFPKLRFSLETRLPSLKNGPMDQNGINMEALPKENPENPPVTARRLPPPRKRQMKREVRPEQQSRALGRGSEGPIPGLWDSSRLPNACVAWARREVWVSTCGQVAGLWVGGWHPGQPQSGPSGPGRRLWVYTPPLGNSVFGL